jgi:hypothetical protein
MLSKLVGASTAVWPMGATTLSVTYQPGRVISPGNVLLVDNLATALLGASITSIIHRDTDLISGTGSVPAAIFSPTSYVNTARFGQIRPEEPVIVNYAVAAGPGANTSFPTCLGPLDVVRKLDLKSKAAAQKVATAAKKKVKAAAKKKSAPLWKRALRGVWRRLPGVAGVGAMSEDDIEYAITGSLDEMVGAFDELIDEAVGAAFDEQVEDETDD